MIFHKILRKDCEFFKTVTVANSLEFMIKFARKCEYVICDRPLRRLVHKKSTNSNKLVARISGFKVFFSL